MAEAVVRISVKDLASAVLRKIRAATKDAQGGFDKLAKAGSQLSSVLAGVGAAAALKGFAAAGVEADRTSKRLKLLSESYGETGELAKFAEQAAERFGIGQTSAASAVTDLYGRLRPMGITLDEIQTTFLGVNNAAGRMNLTAADTAGVMLQLSQALGSGRLQGDEFRSIMERLPAIGQAVAKSMGKPIEELKELSSQGKLTTKEIIKALNSLAKAPPPPVDAFKRFQATLEDLSTNIGKILLPVVTPLVQGVTAVFKAFNKLPRPVKRVVVIVGALAAALAVVVPAIAAVKVAFLALKPILAAIFLGGGGLNALAAGAGVAIIAFADKVKAGFQRILTALKPVADAFMRAFNAVPWQAIGAAIQAVGQVIGTILVAKFQLFVNLLEMAAPIVAAVFDGIRIAIQNSPIGFLVQKAYELAQAFGLIKQPAEELKESTEKVATATGEVKEKIDQAALAKQRMLQLGQQELALATKQKAALKEQEASYENQRSVATARLNAEKAITELTGQQLQRAYEQATTVQQRLQIAKAIYQNQVQLAALERQAAQANIQAEFQVLALKKQGAQIALKEIEAKGLIAQANAKNFEEGQRIAEQTRKAVESQRQAVQLIGSQIEAQREVAKFQSQAAEAQFRAKELTARTAYEQRLTSKEINLSAEQARRLADGAGQSATNTNRTGTAMRQVERVTNSTAVGMNNLAIQAGNAAGQIERAAAAQERLNRAQGGGGGGGGGGGPEGAAKGAYWPGGFKAFAKGGVVNKPTLGLIGEGGESEYIIPQSKAGGFAMNYLSGKRGSAAIPAFAEGGFVGPATPSVSIQTGPVTQMNGTDFVTTQDLGSAVQAGVEQTLQILRRDGTVRKQLGLA